MKGKSETGSFQQQFTNTRSNRIIEVSKATSEKKTDYRTATARFNSEPVGENDGNHPGNDQRLGTW